MAREKKLWLTRTQAAALISLSSRQFDEVIRPRLATPAKRGAGKTLRYEATGVVATFVAYRVDQEVVRLLPDDEKDPLLSVAAGSSPQLERYRKARADLAERDVKERDTDLVRRDVILGALRPAIAGMRGAGDRLVREFGNDAGEIYNEAVDDFADALEKTINPPAASPGHPDSQ